MTDCPGILTKDTYLLILKYTEPIDKIDVLLTYKYFLDICLRNLWKPWSYRTRRRLRCYMDSRQSIVYDGPVTGLLWAVSEGFFEYFRFWNRVAASVGEPFDTTYDNFYPFQKAVENGHFDIVKYFIDGHPDDPYVIPVNPACCLNFALEHACFNGNIKILKLLLADGRVGLIDEFEEPFTPLSNAIFGTLDTMNNKGPNEGNNLEAVKLILADSRFKIGLSGEFKKYHSINPEIFKVLMTDERINKTILGQELCCHMLNKMVDAYSDDILYNNMELVSLVLSYIDLSIKGPELVKHAFSKNKIRILKELLRHKDLANFNYYEFKANEMKNAIPKKPSIFNLIGNPE